MAALCAAENTVKHNEQLCIRLKSFYRAKGYALPNMQNLGLDIFFLSKYKNNLYEHSVAKVLARAI